jgi:hypothetical protein
MIKPDPTRQPPVPSKVSKAEGFGKTNRLQRFLMMQARQVMSRPAVSVAHS